MININPITNKSRAILLTLTCIILWAFIPVVSKFGQSNLDNYQFLFYSSLFSFIVVLISSIISWKLKELFKYKIKDLTNIAWLSFLWAFFYYLLLYYWYANAKWLEVLVLQYTWAIFIVIFSIIFLKEKLTLKTVISLILWFIWVCLIITKWNLSKIYLDNIFVDFVVLIWASSFWLFSVLSKKVNYEAYSITTLLFLFATIFSFISMITLSSFIIPYSTSWISILINWALVNWISYIIWIKALSYGEANFIAPFTFLTPVFASLLLIIFFKEEFLTIYALWLALVILAGIINIFKK